MNENADNLLYEYFVGRYLNKRINKHFPFFVCTHGLYKYKPTMTMDMEETILII